MAAGYQRIGLAREIESPENPGGLEKRVALVPEDVRALVEAGAGVAVEAGAGEGVGFTDDEYLAAGARIESAAEIYRDKDLLIKFKGPAMASISEMAPGCTLFCMAHFHSYPERAALLEQQRINVIAMEEVLESPKSQSDLRILGRLAMNDALTPIMDDNTIGGTRIRVLQWSPRLDAAIRRAGNRDPRSLDVLQGDSSYEELNKLGTEALYFYDSDSFVDRHGILPRLERDGCRLYDMARFEAEQGAEATAAYRTEHPPHPFGMRRIQCLHETGRAGARYGVELLQQNQPDIDLRHARVVVLGYGNVGQGAIHELNEQGVGCVNVLGRTHTMHGRIDYWLRDADLIVNGAEQPAELRGLNFLVSNEHLETLVPDGSVVIDLVGGSPTNRSPVEAVLSCTFLTDPYFVHSGVTVSSLWGWPMMGMMRDTALRYSSQIRDVLLGPEQLLSGLQHLAPGVERALVCGPFE
ncbi:MAG: alanine dehydrogenase [Halieaceae bacterium]|nr:alanine dehydrogenase [Halieaceae bacterium]